MTICGIDEAGRGPIIGPLVMCGLCVKDEKELEGLGVKDSKLLTPKQREEAFKHLIKFKHHVVVIMPREIDAAVTSDNGDNLNWLEGRKVAEIINFLKPKTAIVDCPSPNITAYTIALNKQLTTKSDIIAEHHADANHLVVGAASIIAKVTRDRMIEDIKKQRNADFGSGYVADPKTAAFLQKYWNKHPEIFRHSWAPYQKLVKAIGQKKLI